MRKNDNYIENELPILFPFMRLISEEELNTLYKRIKPIISIDGEKYLLKDFSLSQIQDRQFDWNNNANIIRKLDDNDLMKMFDFLCLHTRKECASLSEILSQVPENMKNSINAFEIIESSEEREHLFVHARGLHLSKVRTYKMSK